MTEHEHWSELITLDRILSRHADIMTSAGGLRSQPRSGCVEGSVGNAWSAQLYCTEDQQKCDVLVFAGYLLYYLARNQCFSDGNRRVAWSVTIEGLGTQGLEMTGEDEEIATFLESVVADKAMTGDRVVSWVADRLVEINSRAS